MPGPPGPPRLRTARPLALAVVALLVLDLVLAWLALQAAFVFVELVWLTAAAKGDFRGLLEAHVRQFGTLRSLQGGAWLATAGAFLGWLHRAHRNLPALGVMGLGYSHGQVLTAFLVPGLNVIRPLRIVREVWSASDPRHREGVAWRGAPVPGWVAGWWVLLVAAALAELGVQGFTRGAGTPLGLGRAMPLLVAGQCLQIAAAVAAIAVVLRIDRYQEEKIARARGA